MRQQEKTLRNSQRLLCLKRSLRMRKGAAHDELAGAADSYKAHEKKTDCKYIESSYSGDYIPRCAANAQIIV